MVKIIITLSLTGALALGGGATAHEAKPVSATWSNATVSASAGVVIP